MEEIKKENQELEVLEEQKEEKKEVVKREPIKTTNGVIMTSSFEEQYRLARCYVQSKLLPKSFDTPEKVVVALQLCYELGLPPMSSIRQIAVINGTPSLFGDLPLALAMKSGLLKKYEEKLFDKEGNEIDEKNQKPVFMASCYGERVDGSSLKTMFSLADAENAGLLGSNCWKKYPKDMLVYRARGRLLKSLVPDALQGVAQGEYDYGITIEEASTKNIGSSVSEGLAEEIRSEKE